MESLQSGPCLQMIMRLSKALIDMEMADYSAALDPAYTTLEFENMQVLAMGSGKSISECCFSLSKLGSGQERFRSQLIFLQQPDNVEQT